jgi:hypothetical protein
VTQHRMLVVGVGARSLAVGTLQALRHQGDVAHIVGIDSSPHAVGQGLCDTFAVMPPATDPAFPVALRGVLDREDVTLILPLIDAGLTTVVQVADMAGVQTIAPDPDRLPRIIDKGLLLQYLVEQGLHRAAAYVPQSRMEVAQAAEAIGYPQRRVVVKPRIGSGARGVWILDSTPRRDPIAGPRGIPTITLDAFLDCFDELFRWDQLVVTPEAAGEHYTVLFLQRSEGDLVVPIRRTAFDCGTTWGGVVEDCEPVSALAQQVCARLDVGPVANVQLAWDGTSGQILEVNPRLSSTTSSLWSLEVDVLGLLLAEATGRTTPEPAVPWGTEFRRYVTDIHIDLDGGGG